MQSTATKATTRACDACQYWQALDNSDGECRRYAPRSVAFKVDDNTTFEAKFPVTASNDWCGEFEPKA
ncbi:MAG: Uncharacterized protein E1N59_577 [Puniceicoccaceae bacterium 5H]|nr:MAG: Uncharacterized protein E1N59_577 [Puniceicoccaceae bacterium 5H]